LDFGFTRADTIGADLRETAARAGQGVLIGDRVTIENFLFVCDVISVVGGAGWHGANLPMRGLKTIRGIAAV
jgi:hypothetical protein